jgi:hypothetical protein
VYPLGLHFAFAVLLAVFMALKTACFRLGPFATFTSLFVFSVTFLIAGMLRVSCLGPAWELWMWLAEQ